MTDLHAHILPGMDDGSRSVEESLAMLEASADQGIARIAATPHFYPSENSPEEFLARRARAAARLGAVWHPGLPEIKLGAEVCYFEGISRAGALGALRIEGTPLLLVEMPFVPWTERMLQELRAVQQRPGIRVLLAHVERYLHLQTVRTWDALEELGVLSQCNAEFFLHWRTRRKALRLLRRGRVHLLGSDCHGMDRRPPQLGKALARLDGTERDILRENLRRFLPGWEVVL